MSSAWQSPVDGHVHWAEIDRVGCAVCELAAERDRFGNALTMIAMPPHDDPEFAGCAGCAAAAQAALDGTNLRPQLADIDPNPAIEALTDIIGELELGDGAYDNAAIVEAVKVLRADRDSLRIIVNALRDWNMSEERGALADTVEEQDRHKDEAQAAFTAVLILLADFDRLGRKA